MEEEGKKIGIDLGTTNSTVSFYKDNRIHTHTLSKDITNRSSYIPSVVAINKNNEEDILIGEDALKADKNNYYIYSKFKILLDATDENLKSFSYEKHTPKEIITIYLKQIIKSFEESEQCTVDSLVLTVPEIWLKDDLPSRTIIDDVLKSLDIQVKLIGEAVSAGAYFLHNHSTFKKGHVVVFDFGGGTLDIALLEVDGRKLKVLERVGKSRDEILTGKAGVAYDDVVLDLVADKKGIEYSKKTNDSYSELLKNFEDKKRSDSKNISIQIENYLKNDKLNNPLMKLYYTDDTDNAQPINVLPSHMVEGFESFDADIKEELSKIKKFCKTNHIDIDDQEEFKIIMAGGFSNFHLSKKSVRTFFDTKKDDKRFEDGFMRFDTELSISKGAILVAEGKINIDATSSVTITIPILNIDHDNIFTEGSLTILRKGDSIVADKFEYEKQIITKAGDIVLNFDFEDDSKISSYRLENNLDDIFCNPNKLTNRWTIGCSIDKNEYIILHTKDIDNQEKTIEMGDLIYRIGEGLAGEKV